jgi:hypothetical protein
MFYLHPWEIDPHQPRVAGASLVNQWRHRVNLPSTARKLALLLSTFRFGAIGDVLPPSPSDVADVDNHLDRPADLFELSPTAN